MLQIYIGDGKGKTTAAAGSAIRAVGSGYKVLYARFMKSRTSGETETLRQIGEVKLFMLKGKYPFFKDMTEEEKNSIREEQNEQVEKLYEAYNINKKTGKKTMVICDEILHAIKYDLIDCDNAYKKIVIMAEDGEVILTGREITDDRYEKKADYISEVKKIKHPFDRGITARGGIEY